MDCVQRFNCKHIRNSNRLELTVIVHWLMPIDSSQKLIRPINNLHLSVQLYPCAVFVVIDNKFSLSSPKCCFARPKGHIWQWCFGSVVDYWQNSPPICWGGMASFTHPPYLYNPTGMVCYYTSICWTCRTSIYMYSQTGGVLKA